MLMINNNKMTQLIYDHSSVIPQFIHPKTVVESFNYKNFVSEGFDPFSPEMFRDQEHVAFIRQYALGDLFQLAYVVRKFKKFYNVKKVTVACAQSFISGLIDCFPDIKFEVYHPGLEFNAGVILMLDGNLEKDHSITNPENQIHRINIFNRNLGMSDVSKTTPEEWAFRADGIKFEGEPGVKYIGLQIRGSAAIKTLPYDYIVELARTLSKEYKVVLLDHDKNKGFSGENIIDTCGKLDVQQCVSLLAHLSAVITMDSGMLWMAHAASVPTICILGSTREEERVSLHPLYPEKAKSISLSHMVNCKPCFETRVNCKGRHFCMNDFPRNQLTDTIRSYLKQIVGEEPNGQNEQAGHRETIAE